MIYKHLKEPKKLIILRSLHNRMNLSETDRQSYYSLEKGYEGEVMFDRLTEKLQCECLILNDLLLKVNNTTFQIDTLIISQDKLFLFEIKNLDGDYFLEQDRLYKLPRTEYNNPLHQLSRCESLLRQLLQILGFNLPIEGNVVFINPEFTLYQAPRECPIIFPTQVNSYLKKINETPSKLTAKHRKLAEKLVSLHIEESPYTVLPSYEYEQLRKGIICGGCGSFSVDIQRHKCVCTDCGNEELTTSAILRSINEFKLLFPEKKVSAKVIYEWCKIVECKKTIARVLDRNFNKIGVRQWTYYK